MILGKSRQFKERIKKTQNGKYIGWNNVDDY